MLGEIVHRVSDMPVLPPQFSVALTCAAAPAFNPLSGVIVMVTTFLVFLAAAARKAGHPWAVISAMLLLQQIGAILAGEWALMHEDPGSTSACYNVATSARNYGSGPAFFWMIPAFIWLAYIGTDAPPPRRRGSWRVMAFLALVFVLPVVAYSLNPSEVRYEQDPFVFYHFVSGLALGLNTLAIALFLYPPRAFRDHGWVIPAQIIPFTLSLGILFWGLSSWTFVPMGPVGYAVFMISLIGGLAWIAYLVLITRLNTTPATFWWPQFQFHEETNRPKPEGDPEPEPEPEVRVFTP